MKKIAIILTTLIASGLAYFIYKKQEDHFMSTQLIPREVLFGNPEKAAVKLSADGKRLSYLANLNGVLNIFIANRETPNESKPITKDTRRGIRRYFWLYDDQHIVYLKDDGGDENWRIHVVNVSTKEDKIFTSEKVNARIYHVSDNFPQEILIGLNDRDPAYHDVYRLNILTGEKTLIL